MLMLHLLLLIDDAGESYAQEGDRFSTQICLSYAPKFERSSFESISYRSVLNESKQMDFSLIHYN